MLCDANPPYPLCQSHIVEPCRAESASVADSADNLDVGVSLWKACVRKMPGGSLIPTYESIISYVYYRIRSLAVSPREP